MNWEVIYKFLPKLLEGAWLTLELVGIAVIAGLILAIPLGIARASKHWYVRALPTSWASSTAPRRPFMLRRRPLLPR